MSLPARQFPKEGSTGKSKTKSKTKSKIKMPLQREIGLLKESEEKVIHACGYFGGGFLRDAVFAHALRAVRLGRSIRLLSGESMYRESGILFRCLVETLLSLAFLVQDKEKATDRAKRFEVARAAGLAKLTKAQDTHKIPIAEPERSAILRQGAAYREEWVAPKERADTWHGKTWVALSDELRSREPVYGQLYDLCYTEFSWYVHSAPEGMSAFGEHHSDRVILYRNDDQPGNRELGLRVVLLTTQSLLLVQDLVLVAKRIPVPFLDALVSPGCGVAVKCENVVDPQPL